MESIRLGFSDGIPYPHISDVNVRRSDIGSAYRVVPYPTDRYLLPGKLLSYKIWSNSNKHGISGVFLAAYCEVLP